MIAATQTPLTDLIRRVGCGDEPALTDLRQQTQAWLAGSIRRIVKDPWNEEEILQDVYTYIWLHAAEYRSERGTPLAWLCILARSRAIDRLRLTRRHNAAVEFDDQAQPTASADPSREPVEPWQRFMVRTALSELSGS